MITVIPTTNNRCSIELYLGNSYTVHHMKADMVRPFVLHATKEAILKFCRLSLEDMQAHPRCARMFDRVSHTHAFQHSIRTMDTWDGPQLARHVRQCERLMLGMLPHPESNQYQRLSQLAFDILLIVAQEPSPL